MEEEDTQDKARKAARVEKEDVEVNKLSKVEDGPSPLMFLPKEIWTLIFNYISQQSKIYHRLVSKEWCKNVDEFSTVDVNFNSDYPSERYRQRVFELRIRGCTFSSLRVPFSPEFKNPLLVKEITFTTHVSASNVLNILSLCTNVESLKFLTTMSSESALKNDDQTIRVLNNLKNLQYLEIGILTFLERNEAQESRTFKCIIGNENVVFPSLKGLRIAFSVLHVEWFQIFKFLSRHSMTIKSLNAICPCGESSRSGCKELRRKDLIPNNLVLPQLDSIVVNGACECSCREDVWLLLDQQKHLRRFESDISRGVVFMRDVIEKNQESIRVLKLHEIGSMFCDELDCELFSKCVNLQDLSLFVGGDCGCIIVVNVGGGTAQHRIPVLRHLDALPKGLRRLTLCGSQILSAELEKLFSPDRALEEVTLGRADSMKSETFGMTINILVKTLENLKKLKKFRIFLDMICEVELPHADFCADIKGVWLRVFELSKEIEEANNNGTSNADDHDGRCCGTTYNDICSSHRPYFDIVLKNDAARLEFLSRMKELQLFHQRS